MILAISIALAVVSLLVLLALREASRETEDTLPLRHVSVRERESRVHLGSVPRKPSISARPADNAGKKEAGI